MFEAISNEPRKFARMIKGEGGGEWPNPNKQLVQPTPFGSVRGQEILAEARRTTGASMPLRDFSDLMTEGELVYVLAVWDCCSGSSCWMSAFNHIANGDVEAYQTAAALVSDEPESYAVKQ